jgi:metal-responsive CopG/Arc/MetJ family transcriptional regulator
MGIWPQETCIHVTLTAVEIRRLDCWMSANRISSRSDAIRLLLQTSLPPDGTSHFPLAEQCLGSERQEKLVS